MNLLVCASREFDPKPVKALLEPYGLDVSALSLGAVQQEGALSDGLSHCVLILPEQGVVSVGEPTELLRRQLGPDIPLILCTPQPGVEERDVLHECGASQLVTPPDWNPRGVADRVLAELILSNKVAPASCGEILGATLAMQELYGKIEKIAPLNDPVLVLGKTGTGKELVAHELHRQSGRPGKVLAINCAALTPELLESELFGHKRGAFTGADTQRRGLLEEAGAGTVFLDEIGELTLSSQSKLLRVLEERSVRPVGSNKWVDVKSRLILATNRDLETAVRESSFRAELHYRIRGFALTLPLLRKRKADIPLLARHFLAEYNEEYRKDLKIGPEAYDTLLRYSWPGNVRELRLAVRQAAAYASSPDGEISLLSLQESTRPHRRPEAPGHRTSLDPTADTWKMAQERLRETYFLAVLEAAGGDKDVAASIAGVSRSQFYAILRQIRKTED